MSSTTNAALATVEPLVDSPTPLLSSVISSLSTDAMPFTGERFVFGSGVEIFYEHFHRYVFANRLVQPTQTVLDLGCGVGYGSLLIASRAKKVIALDVDRDSISLLKELASKVGAVNLQAVCGDVLDIAKLVSEPVDVVVCHELIEHLPRDVQEKLIELISSGQPPFHAGTRLFISTPEKIEYNRRSQTSNKFHEHEFTKAEFGSFLQRYFPRVQMLWQGTITGNIIASGEASQDVFAASFVRWQDIMKLHAVVESAPHDVGSYMYAIAGRSVDEPAPTSLLVDQAERLVLEKLTIAAKELNQKNGTITQLSLQLEKVRASLGIEQLAQDKIKRLLRECEELGARILEADREQSIAKDEMARTKASRAALEQTVASLRSQLEEVSHIARSLTEAPLEVKFAIKCMLTLPHFIRRIIRRVLAIAVAVARG